MITYRIRGNGLCWGNFADRVVALANLAKFSRDQPTVCFYLYEYHDEHAAKRIVGYVNGQAF